jgi:guanylate kinase
MRRVVEAFPCLEFSISATSRKPRHTEQHGVDYFFMTADEFMQAVESDKFVEWEEVYAGTHYGTLRSEMERIWDAGKSIIFDVDVKGGLRLKHIFGDNALAIFIMPPSLNELERRLIGRGTDSPEQIAKRVAKASAELEYADRFDISIVNDDLERATSEVLSAISEFLDK